MYLSSNICLQGLYDLTALKLAIFITNTYNIWAETFCFLDTFSPILAVIPSILNGSTQ